MSVARVFFHFAYNPIGKPLSGSAFLLGLRFDAKFASILCLVLLIVTQFGFANPFKNKLAEKFWKQLLALLFVLLFALYTVDYFHYDYLHQRLSASVLNYLEDAATSLKMVWQTYPVTFALLGILMVYLMAYFTLAYIFNRQKETYSPILHKAVQQKILLGFVFAGLIFGKLNQYNLRWSDAFTLGDDYKANLALNPLQSFFSSLKFRDQSVDSKAVATTFPIMQQELELSASQPALNFTREVSFAPSQPLNVIVVICESFSAYKSSMFGNALNPTPFFDSLSKQGLFFTRCFTPAYGTARGVWATITGLPDVTPPGSTASRNPMAVSQRLSINSFKNHNKFYFLGGDPSWANIQGLLKNNIDSLKLYSQEDFKAKKVDVWGISDKNLFLEANQLLAKQEKPFFAVIQTADNHRPYTIPIEDKAAFNSATKSELELQQNGFESIEELNAFRYTDYCFEQFIAAAKKENYFKNTIFVFVGDHGIKGQAKGLPKVYTEYALTAQHVPLLFYAPGIIKPQTISWPCSQLDVITTSAALAKQSFTSYTFGKNLLTSQKHHAFIYHYDMQHIGIVDEQYIYIKNIVTKKQDLFSAINDKPIDLAVDSIRWRKEQLSQLAEAYFLSAKYLLSNNKN